MVIAHRGFHKAKKENTIAAFEAAFEAGADAIETDVRLTKDNQVVVNHDDKCKLGTKEIIISETPLDKILELRRKDDERILTLDELFGYIIQTQKYFFIELKSNASELSRQVVNQIEKNNLWKKVHLIGFFNNIGSALAFQGKHPELKVCQLIMLPILSRFFKPKKSYAVFVGWLDGVKYSEQLFKAMIPEKRLEELKKYYEKLGFKVYGGVINHEHGLEFFRNAGIHDIFTDEVGRAVSFFKK